MQINGISLFRCTSNYTWAWCIVWERSLVSNERESFLVLAKTAIYGINKARSGGFWQQSWNPVCHQGLGTPLGTAALSWSLQHLNGVLCLSTCLFSLLSRSHLIGKIFSWQAHLVGELWERCQPAYSSFPVEREREPAIQTAGVLICPSVSAPQETTIC